METTAIIVAAGTGTRCGGTLPKQFQQLGDKWVLDYSVEFFTAKMPVVIVTSTNWQAVLQEKYPNCTVVTGGSTRQQSVKAGLTAVKTSWVLIHDAARPFVQEAVLERLLTTTSIATIPVLPVTDTIKQVSGNAVTQTVNRDILRAVQTPQLFDTTLLKQLHTNNNNDVTDDATLFEAAGHPVQIVEGHPDTFKITAPADMQRAKNLLQQPSYKVGSGFDVHAFTDGDHIMLGGVKVPHTKGLAAHSDGDVLLHALTDAILGAIGQGDIGLHFPPSDDQWKDATSTQFVKHSLKLMQQAGYRLSNVDITVIAEAPKLNPYREVITNNLQSILGIEAVNLKATTTEKLGFTGRKEGVAMMASVIIFNDSK